MHQTALNPSAYKDKMYFNINFISSFACLALFKRHPFPYFLLDIGVVMSQGAKEWGRQADPLDMAASNGWGMPSAI
jgi:hypothetical protein